MSSIAAMATGTLTGVFFGTIANFGGKMVGSTLCCETIPFFDSMGSIAGGVLLTNSLEESVFATGVKVGVFCSTMFFSPMGTIYHTSNRMANEMKSKLLDESFLVGCGVGAVATAIAGPEAGIMIGGAFASVFPGYRHESLRSEFQLVVESLTAGYAVKKLANVTLGSSASFALGATVATVFAALRSNPLPVQA